MLWTGILHRGMKYLLLKVTEAIKIKAQHAEGVMVGKWVDKHPKRYISTEFEEHQGYGNKLSGCIKAKTTAHNPLQCQNERNLLS